MASDIVRGFLSILGARVGTIGLHIVITPFLVRFLGPQYGDYAFVLSVLTMVLMFVEDSLFDSVRKFVSEERSTPAWEAEVLGFYLRVAALSGAAVVVGIALAIRFGVVTAVLPPVFVRYFLLVAGIVVAQQLFTLGRSALMGFGLEHVSEPLMTTRKLVFGVLAIGSLSAGGGVTGVLASELVATVLMFLVALWFVSRELSFRHVLTPQSSSFPRRELLRYNTTTVVFIVLSSTLNHVDVVLLRLFTGSVETGYYKAALLAAEFLWVIPVAMDHMLVHSSSAISSRGEDERIEEITGRVVRYSVLIAGLLTVMLAAFADVLVPLYFGASYERAVLPTLLLLPGAFAYAVALPLIGIVQGIGALRRLVLATASAAGLNLVLNLLFIPRYGMYGAAAATSVGFLTMLSLHLWSVRSLGIDPFSDLRPATTVASLLVTGAVVVGVAAVGPQNLLTVLFGGAIGSLTYLGVTLKTGAVDSADVQLLVDVLPESVRKTLTF